MAGAFTLIIKTIASEALMMARSQGQDFSAALADSIRYQANKDGMGIGTNRSYEPPSARRQVHEACDLAEK